VYHTEQTIEFTATGSPNAISREIETFAKAQGGLNATVVPWESDSVTLSMSVTSARGHGWNLEHTNLGTIKLTDQGNSSTKVAISSHEPNHPDKEKLAAVFDRFAREIQSKLQAL